MTIPYLLELTAVGVFAASGCLAAGRKRLDLIGVILVSTVTAVGGGTVRDLLLNRHPISWIGDANFLLVIAVANLVTPIWVRFRPAPDRSLFVVDAIGLSVFSIVGTEAAEDHGAPGIVCVAMGLLTGTAGGIVRDILCREFPLILRGKYLYGSAALAGATAYIALVRTGCPRGYAEIVGMGVVGALRFGSIAWSWHLPIFELGEDGTRGRLVINADIDAESTGVPD